MHDSLMMAASTIVVLLGVLRNRWDAASIRSDFGGSIAMLTGKVIAPTDLVWHIKARMGK